MLDFGIHNRFNSLPLCMLWIINWKWLAMGRSVNYTTVWGSFSVWPHEQSGELGSYSERTSDYDIIYRTLQRKPFSVNYLFYPIDCFWFLNSNLQCQNLLSFFLCIYIGYFRISTKQNQNFMTITRSNPISAVILGKSIFGYFLYPGPCLLNDVILSLCALECDGHWRL